jgi:hypothetical protein
LLFNPVNGILIPFGALPAVTERREALERRLELLKFQSADKRADVVVGCWVFLGMKRGDTEACRQCHAENEIEYCAHGSLS